MRSSHEHSFFGAVPPGCQLGNREWTVVYHDPVVSEDRVSKLEREFRDFKAGAIKDAVYLGKPEVVNMASQVLLFAAREQPCMRCVLFQQHVQQIRSCSFGLCQ